MIYRLIILVSIFSINCIQSQDLFVADNSYIYSKDVVVFVNNDIRLDTPTSNIYLRGDAQLIQNADIKNSDEGELSIYQNQTIDIYEYNYWCSPVGVADATSNINVDFKGSNIHDPADELDLANVNSTPYTFTYDYDGTLTELSSQWIFTLKDAEGYADWSKVFHTGDIETGYGFTLKGSPNANNVLDFRGRPNNGTITVSCSFDGTDNQPNSGKLDYAETLTGNPYPSTLDLKLFFVNSINNQTDLSGEIFFWEQKQKNSHYLADYEGGYAVYTPGDLGDLSDNGSYAIAAFEAYNGDGSSSGNTSGNTTDFSANNSRRYAAVGQGFIIASNVDGGTATFDNSMRLIYIPEDPIDGSIFAKNGNSKSNQSKEKRIPMSHNGVDYKSLFENPTIIPEIRIHTHINNTFYKENVIAFRESTPNNNTYNKFYDGRNINELSSDTYIISSGKSLAIKSINYHESTRLPLGFKASKNNTTFSVKINKLKNVPEDVNVYVFDNENNTYTDIKNGAFEVHLDTGVYNNRFEITFIENNSLSVDDTIFDDLKVFQNNTTAQLKIFNPNSINIKTFSLFDVSGKEVLNDTNISSKKEIWYTTKSLSSGVYVSKLTTDTNQTFTKKIMISNSN